MQNEDRIIELLSEMLQKHDQAVDQLVQLNSQNKELNSKVGELNTKFEELNSKVEELNSRVGRLENEQQTTNVLLMQHNRDLLKIADLLANNYPQYNHAIEIEMGGITHKAILKKLPQ